MKADPKREILRRYTAEPEDALMLAKLLDKAELCRSRGFLQATRFLSLHECILAEKLIRGEKLFPSVLWGGFEGAERRCAVFFPDYLTEEDAKEQSGVAVLRAAFRPGTLTHRDLLGSLMNAGVTRDCIGDLLVHEDFCDILCLEETAPFLLENVSRAGRETLRLTRLSGPPAAVEEKAELLRDTVASLRLDAVLSSACRVSRGAAAELVSAGRVKLNDFECTKADRPVEAGDVLSVRGYGRVVLQSVEGQSRKGRTVIVLKRFL